jgi:hypothetical protein
MPARMNVSTIQQLLAPVVMISACGLLCLALYNRLATVVSRIRQFNRERLEHAIRERSAGDTVRRALELHRSTLEKQIPTMLNRARLIHNALMCIIACLICMLASSLTIGVSMLWTPAFYGAVAFFVLGLLLAFSGMVMEFRELTMSLGEVELETHALEDLPTSHSKEHPEE